MPSHGHGGERQIDGRHHEIAGHLGVVGIEDGRIERDGQQLTAALHHRRSRDRGTPPGSAGKDDAGRRRTLRLYSPRIGGPGRIPGGVGLLDQHMVRERCHLGCGLPATGCRSGCRMRAICRRNLSVI